MSERAKSQPKCLSLLLNTLIPDLKLVRPPNLAYLWQKLPALLASLYKVVSDHVLVGAEEGFRQSVSCRWLGLGCSRVEI
jgi:hypothetical protein